MAILQGRNGGGDKVFRITDARVPSGERSNASQQRNRRTGLELVDMDELAELQLVTENEIVVLFGERHISGMQRIGDLEVEAMVGPKLATGQGRDDANDLKKNGTVLTGDFNVGIHVLEQFQEDARGEGSHGRNGLS